MSSLPIHGRGTGENPGNRFETIRYEVDPDLDPEERPSPRTVFLRDTSRSIIVRNDSPDVGFDASINPYRGCEHGCIYCYARPYHEYLGFSSGLDFETKILVKENAADLLRRELASPGWKPEILGISGVTDPYQPIERQLRLTRGCLEVLAEFRNPVRVITKNHLVTRDADLLSELAGHHAAGVFLSVTTLDEELRRVMEPRTATAAARLEAIRTLSGAGVPTGVMVAPIIPGLNDHEVPAILSAAAGAGALFAAYTIVRLPYAVNDLFIEWLARHFPDRKDKVLGGIRSVRGGKLNDSRFGSRMRGEGARADIIKRMFRVASKNAGIPQAGSELSTAAFRRSGPPALFPI
jgi:DNA repair photolyase